MPISRKELVDQAIRFGSPDRVPIVYWNRDQTEGDVMLYHLALGAPGDGTPNTWNWSTNDLIMDDFHKIGADVINISQPNVMDVAAVGRRLRGRQCFMMPISYQTVSISGTPAEIRAEAQRLHHLLGAPEGGFIGYVEEYSVMGMSAENYRACGDAFRCLRPSQP